MLTRPSIYVDIHAHTLSKPIRTPSRPSETSEQVLGALTSPSLPLTQLLHWDWVPVLLSHVVPYIEAPFAKDTLEFSLWFSLARCVVVFVFFAYINFGFPLQVSQLAVQIRS